MVEARNLTHREKVARVSEPASIAVSEQVLGRVIDPLGNPLDGLGPIGGKKLMLPIDKKAPGILQRSRVVDPLETGVTIVDMMVQIGKGQIIPVERGAVRQITRPEHGCRCWVGNELVTFGELDDDRLGGYSSQGLFPQVRRRLNRVAGLLYPFHTFEELLDLDSTGFQVLENPV